MIAPQCPIHKSPMNLKPAGVSKKGTRYSAFWSCPVQDPNGSYCQTPTIKDSEWQAQQNEEPHETFNRSLKEEPIKAVEVPDEEIKYNGKTPKEWNFKNFTEDLRALTFEVRKADMHPSQVWDTTHLKEWMRALHADDEGYDEWELGLETRLAGLSKEWTRADEAVVNKQLEKNES